MSSIRSILEEVYNAGEGRDFRQEGTMSDSIDKALKDISELIDKAKPDYAKNQDRHAEEQAWAFNHGIDQYQSNLKELLK